MGAVTSYSLSVAIYLIAGCLVYRLFLRKGISASASRVLILAIFGIALSAPALARFIAQLFTSVSIIQVTPSTVSPGAVVELLFSGETANSWCKLFVAIYSVGILLMLLRFLIGWVKIFRIIRTGSHIEREGYKIVVTDCKNPVSFSWLNVAVISGAHAPTDLEMVITHEIAHITHHHWLDLIFVQAVCIFQWYNPAAWWLARELKAVHEYQADAAVLSRGGDLVEYQRLLVRSHLASRHNYMVNTFESSNLKKRISMMNNNVQSTGRRIFRAIALMPALALAFGLTQIPAVATALTATGSVSLSGNEHTDTVFIEVEVRPEFPGGEGALIQWLSQNMKYPESMLKADIQGREIVGFKVMADGTIADVKIIRSICPEADEEVLRLMGEMPKWKPGTINGKPVAVTYTLPITFKLLGNETKEENPVRVISVNTEATADNKTTQSFTAGGSESHSGPEIFVDGMRHIGGLNSINLQEIESITVVQDAPENPNGRIDITLKKK